MYLFVVKVNIRQNSLLAAIAARKLGTSNMAIVVGSTIYLHGVTAKTFIQDKKWLLHELKHIEQYQRQGMLRFLVNYLWESVKNGYRNNKFEREARQAENEEILLQAYDISEYQF